MKKSEFFLAEADVMKWLVKKILNGVENGRISSLVSEGVGQCQQNDY